MVISSLLVETAPDKTPTVSKQLAQRTGVDVHGMQDSRIIVTIEAETIDDSHAIASAFIEIEGVLNVNLIYANFEDDPSLKPAVA